MHACLVSSWLEEPRFQSSLGWCTGRILSGICYWGLFACVKTSLDENDHECCHIMNGCIFRSLYLWQTVLFSTGGSWHWQKKNCSPKRKSVHLCSNPYKSVYLEETRHSKEDYFLMPIGLSFQIKASLASPLINCCYSFLPFQWIKRGKTEDEHPLDFSLQAYE